MGRDLNEILQECAGERDRAAGHPGFAGVCAFGRTERDGEAVFAPQRDYLAHTFGGLRPGPCPLQGLSQTGAWIFNQL